MAAAIEDPAADGGGETDAVPSAAELARRLLGSQRLRRRHFELLPLTGPDAAFSDPQGRGPGASTAPADLAELISSIATVGVLQPILVEELPGGARRVVAGERRLRAGRWGAVNQPDNPHFAAMPAVVCPGPLDEGERRVWQLVENLAREDLQPGELAAALLYERCAVLVAKLLAAGVAVPAEVNLDDPVRRWEALEHLRVRSGCHHLGAPWEEVLRRLGIQMRAERAKDLVRAFKALPVELSADMDAHKIALATRMTYLRLDRGCQAAADELWAAVKARGRPELLCAAVWERLEHQGLDGDGALDRAEERHAAADEARRAALSPAAEGDSAGDEEPVDVAGALEALRGLLAVLRSGKRLAPYDVGSLRLFAEELLGLVEQLPTTA
jgi:ParB family chromosome partitioning protein